MRAKLVVTLAAVALVASSCSWGEPRDGRAIGNDFTEKGTAVDNVAPLQRRWSASLANPVIAITESHMGLIDVTDGTTLTALDEATGATVWSRTEPAGATVSGMTSDGNDILLTTIDSATQATNLVVRDARTGATISTTPIAPHGGPEPPGSLQLGGVTKSGPWVVTTWSGSNTHWNPPQVLGGFQVTNLANPLLSWRFDGSLESPTVIDGYDSPLIMGNRLYLVHTHAYAGDSSFIESRVAAWNLSGCSKQCAPLFETSDNTTGPIASPDGRTLYAATADGFAALDPATGEKQWEAAIDGNTFSNVFAATDDAEVVGSFVSTTEGVQTGELAVYPSTCLGAPCAPTWTTSFPASTYVTNAVVANGVIYAAVEEYDPSGKPMTTLMTYPLRCTHSCRALSRTPVGEEVTSGPVVSNGQVLYGTSSGKVVALRP